MPATEQQQLPQMVWGGFLLKKNANQCPLLGSTLVLSCRRIPERNSGRAEKHSAAIAVLLKPCGRGMATCFESAGHHGWQGQVRWIRSQQEKPPCAWLPALLASHCCPTSQQWQDSNLGAGGCGFLPLSKITSLPLSQVAVWQGEAGRSHKLGCGGFSHGSHSGFHFYVAALPFSWVASGGKRELAKSSAF